MLHEQVQEELFHSECIRYISRHLGQDGTKAISCNIGGLPKPPVGSGSKDTKDTTLVQKQPNIETKIVEISLTSWLVPHSSLLIHKFQSITLVYSLIL